jgi:hypothetical protein
MSRLLSFMAYAIAASLLLLSAYFVITNNETLVYMSLLYSTALSFLIDRENKKLGLVRSGKNYVNRIFAKDYALAFMNYFILFIFILNFFASFRMNLYGSIFYFIMSIKTIANVSLESSSPLKTAAAYILGYVAANIFFVFVSVTKGFPIMPDLIVGVTSMLLTAYVYYGKLDSTYGFIRFGRKDSSW